jgi:RNA polymerase sigma-70 factor (ECF subfamily)
MTTSKPNYADRTDRELWDLWRAGDSRAGNRFCDRYFFQVYRFFTSKLRDDRDAEDLTQKTFLELTRSAARADPQHLRAYVFGVARFVLIAHFDRKSKLGVVAIPDTSIEQIDPGPGLTSFMQQNDERAHLAQALRQLPLDAQIVLELYYWEDMSGSEIALVLGIPEPTLRGRLRRAKTLLSELMRADSDVERRMRDAGKLVPGL